MGQRVKIELEVSPEAAEALRDERTRRDFSELVSRLAERRTRLVDPLEVLFAQISRRAREDGLTDEEIDAELAAHKAERRS